MRSGFRKKSKGLARMIRNDRITREASNTNVVLWRAAGIVRHKWLVLCLKANRDEATA